MLLLFIKTQTVEQLKISTLQGVYGGLKLFLDKAENYTGKVLQLTKTQSSIAAKIYPNKISKNDVKVSVSQHKHHVVVCLGLQFLCHSKSHINLIILNQVSLVWIFSNSITAHYSAQQLKNNFNRFTSRSHKIVTECYCVSVKETVKWIVVTPLAGIYGVLQDKDSFSHEYLRTQL